MLVVKNPPANAGDVKDMGSIPGWGRSPGGGHSNSLQYSCLENPHGQRSLVGYRPRGGKESDTTEQLSTAQHLLSLTGKRFLSFYFGRINYNGTEVGGGKSKKERTYVYV